MVRHGGIRGRAAVAKALVGGGLSVMPMAQTDLVMRAAAIAAVILALFATASGLVLHRDGWNRYRGGLFVALVTLFLLAAGPSRRVPIGPDSPNILARIETAVRSWELIPILSEAGGHDWE